MRPLWAGDETSIESVDVSDTNVNVKIVVRYQTRRGMNVNCVNFRRPINYHPPRKMTRALAQEIAEEIESLTQHPDMPIERIISNVGR